MVYGKQKDQIFTEEMEIEVANWTAFSPKISAV
jgi:hypothetical protein